MARAATLLFLSSRLPLFTQTKTPRAAFPRNPVYSAGCNFGEVLMAEQSADPRVDAYIEKAAPFARPVLKHMGKTRYWKYANC